MRKKTSIFLLTIGLLLLFVIPVSAITWGEPDAGDHPNVGTILFTHGDGWYSCTGTMIASHVMLTAGHCTEQAGVINVATYVRFEENALDGIGDYGNLQDWLDNDWMATEIVIPHPNYDDYSGFPFTYDMGVVILEDAYIPANGFAQLPDEGFLQSLRGRDKNHFVTVGYGMQGTLMPFYMDAWARYKGQTRLLEVNSMLSGKGFASAKFSNNPGIGGGTCYGDSGGPTFYKDTNTIVTVTSFGWAKNGNCVGNDFQFRVDLETSLDFLDDVLEDYGD